MRALTQDELELIAGGNSSSDATSRGYSDTSGPTTVDVPITDGWGETGVSEYDPNATVGGSGSSSDSTSTTDTSVTNSSGK